MTLRYHRSAWLAAYSAGLGAAFLLVAVFFVRGMTLFRWMRDHYRVFSIVGGTILVALGLLLFFDAGQAYSEGQKIDLKQLRTSTGVELRFIMPVLSS